MLIEELVLEFWELGNLIQLNNDLRSQMGSVILTELKHCFSYLYSSKFMGLPLGVISFFVLIFIEPGSFHFSFVLTQAA